MQQPIICRAPRHHQQHQRRHASSSANSMHKVKVASSSLRHRLGQSLAVKDQVVDSVLAVCPALVNEQQLVTANLELLHSLGTTAQQVRRLVLSTPQLLATPIQAWKDFLAAYGLESSQIWWLLANQPQLLLQGSIFGAGRAIMFLKQLGWSDVEISALVIQHPQHSAILLMDVDTQLLPVLHHLTQQQGMSQQAAAAFLRSNPALMYQQLQTASAATAQASEAAAACGGIAAVRRTQQQQQWQPPSQAAIWYCWFPGDPASMRRLVVLYAGVTGRLSPLWGLRVVTVAQPCWLSCCS